MHLMLWLQFGFWSVNQKLQNNSIQQKMLVLMKKRFLFYVNENHIDFSYISVSRPLFSNVCVLCNQYDNANQMQSDNEGA